MCSGGRWLGWGPALSAEEAKRLWVKGEHPNKGAHPDTGKHLDTGDTPGHKGGHKGAHPDKRYTQTQGGTLGQGETPGQGGTPGHKGGTRGHTRTKRGHKGAHLDTRGRTRTRGNTWTRRHTRTQGGALARGARSGGLRSASGGVGGGMCGGGTQGLAVSLLQLLRGALGRGDRALGSAGPLLLFGTAHSWRKAVKASQPAHLAWSRGARRPAHHAGRSSELQAGAARK